MTNDTRICGADAVDPLLAWLDRASEGHRSMYTDPSYRAAFERRIDQRLYADYSVPSDAAEVGGGTAVSSEGEPDRLEG